jgi:hypothetical protein
MSAPVTVDIGSAAGPWPAFLVTGATGTGGGEGTGVNVYYLLDPVVSGGFRSYVASGASVVQTGAATWEIRIAATKKYSGTGAWPWLVPTWALFDSATGVPVFEKRIANPVKENLGGGDSASTAASLTTALTGTNNDLVLTSLLDGRLGNAVSIRYVSPGTNNAALSVSVTGRAITVNLATNGSAAITSTAAQVLAAIEASTAASAMIVGANAGGNNGSGVVTALSATFFTGGLGGLPDPPVTVTL